MKKAIIFAAIASATIAGLTSCHKKPVEPEGNYNTVIGVGGITIHDLPFADSVRGYMRFSMVLPNDTIPGKDDTVTYNATFYPVYFLSSTKKYYYNIPANTKKVLVQVSIQIHNDRNPDVMPSGVNIESVFVEKDGRTLISTPLDFNYPELYYPGPLLGYTF